MQLNRCKKDPYVTACLIASTKEIYIYYTVVSTTQPFNKVALVTVVPLSVSRKQEVSHFCFSRLPIKGKFLS